MSSSSSLSIFFHSLNNNTITTSSSQQHLNNQTRHRSNRSRRGLYDGKDIRTGNNVPFSLKKTKRTFKPNVFRKKLYSEILDEMIQFHVTTSALRTIDKYGGLDFYLLRSRFVTEGEGKVVKDRILKRIEECQRKGEDVLPLIHLAKSSNSDSSVSDEEGNNSREKVVKE